MLQRHLIQGGVTTQTPGTRIQNYTGTWHKEDYTGTWHKETGLHRHLAQGDRTTHAPDSRRGATQALHRHLTQGDRTTHTPGIRRQDNIGTGTRRQDYTGTWHKETGLHWYLTHGNRITQTPGTRRQGYTGTWHKGGATQAPDSRRDALSTQFINMINIRCVSSRRVDQLCWQIMSTGCQCSLYWCTRQCEYPGLSLADLGDSDNNKIDCNNPLPPQSFHCQTPFIIPPP